MCQVPLPGSGAGDKPGWETLGQRMTRQALGWAELGESRRCRQGSWVLENMSLSQWKGWWGQILSVPSYPEYCFP